MTNRASKKSRRSWNSPQAETAKFPAHKSASQAEFLFCIRFSPSIARRESREEVPAKKSNLNEGGLKVSKVERLLKVGNQYIVQIHTDGPQKK